MKNLIALIITLFAFQFNGSAQDKALVVEKTITVLGDCDNCKTSIEKAASYVKGVKKASWDKDKQLLTVVYREDKTTLLDIEKAIAKMGYETQNVKADEAAYEKLPSCCHYRTTEKH